MHRVTYFARTAIKQVQIKCGSPLKEVVVLDISIDELPLLNPEFKRYIKAFKEHDINTTTQLATAYYTYEIAKFKGGRKEILWFDERFH